MFFYVDNEYWLRYLRMRAIEVGVKGGVKNELSKEPRKVTEYERRSPLKNRHWAYAQHTPYEIAAPFPIT
jgi:hypothetical protein